MSDFLISICIPSYNRPFELKRLLESIDLNVRSEIVICEDKAPLRLKVREIVEAFKHQTLHQVSYFENKENLGHGANLRECLARAQGEYIIFMGDDDMFIPNKLGGFYRFLENNTDLAYILRASRQLIDNGEYEYFKYYRDTRFFSPGIETLKALFLKSVFMSGFTIKRKYVSSIKLETLDDTLLFQLYLLAKVSMNYPSAYYSDPFVQGVGDGTSFFGTNKKETALYTPGKLVTNNLNFIKGFFKISKYVDKEFSIDFTKELKLEMSKYSYPLMSQARNLGSKEFCSHVLTLKKLGLAISPNFYVYFLSLLILGEKNCTLLIRRIKSFLGRRPSL